MLVLTTPNIEGKNITKYFGLVSGEAILGANIFKDLFAGIRDIVGGGRRLMSRNCAKLKRLRCRR